MDSVSIKYNQRLFILLPLKRSGVSSEDLVTLYKATARLVLAYVALLWHSSLPDCLSRDLKLIQRRTHWGIYGCGR